MTRRPDAQRFPRLSWLALLRSIGARLIAAPLWVRCLACAAWMAGLWTLSGRSTVFPPEFESPFWAFLGNLGHAPAFGFLCLFLLAVCFGVVRRPRNHAALASSGAPLPALGWRRGTAAFSLTIGYGVLDEWHQSWIAGRHSTLSDVSLDGLAALCVLWVSSYIARRDARESVLRRGLLIGVLLCLSVAGFGARSQ